MKILAIETATDACSAALLITNNAKNDNHFEILAEYELAPRKHTQLILKQVEKLMASSQLTVQEMDAVAFGKGPGAFTGLRIAAGVTQGLALAADLPVIPVSTLAAMAQQAYQQHQRPHILTALDARINEVYWGEYLITDGIAKLLGKEKVISPESIQPSNSPELINAKSFAVGSGWGVYKTELIEKLNHKLSKHSLVGIDAELHPSAEFIAHLAAYDYQQGNLLSVEQAQPVYLRDKVADTIRERQAKKNNS